MRIDLLVIMAVVGGLVRFDAATADDTSLAAARQALDAFIEPVVAADAEAIEAILAPEFQIMRADGVGYDREAYLEGGLPAIDNSSGWRYEELVATAAGDLLVARYHLVIDVTIAGKPVARRAPRLTVFRRAGERWLVVAHANFAAAK